MPIPRPVDVYMTPEQAQAVLDEVAAHLREGRWSFEVPNRAIDAVKRELTSSLWLAAIVPGETTARVLVIPRSAEFQELQSALDSMFNKTKN